MFNKIIKTITDKFKTEAEVEPLPRVYPETIEVSYDDVREILMASANAAEKSKALNEYIVKVENEKQRIHRIIVESQEATRRLAEDIREKYNVPNEPEYILTMPRGAGEPARFFKKKKNEEEINNA